MKKSSFIHGVSIVTAILGALALIGALLADENRTIFSFSQIHYFYIAIIFELMSVSAGICALYRRQLERESQ